MTLDQVFSRWQVISQERFGSDSQIISEQGGFCGPCANCSGNLHFRWNHWGNIELNCESGCEQSDIAEGLGISTEDLLTKMDSRSVTVFRLCKLAEERFDFERDAYGQLLATPHLDNDYSGEGGMAVLLRSRQFLEFLGRAFWGLEQHCASQHALTHAQRLLGTYVAESAPVIEERSTHRLLWFLESFAQAHSPTWTGTMTELFKLLPPGGRQPAAGDDWPYCVRGLRKMLEDLSPQIAHLGVKVEFLKRKPRDGKRMVRVTTLTNPHPTLTTSKPLKVGE